MIRQHIAERIMRIGHYYAGLHAMLAMAASSWFKSMPDCGFVGISMTFMPSDAALSRMPKYVGLSIAITSPGFATARRLSLRASRAPQVTAMSRGDTLQPISGERRAI